MCEKFEAVLFRLYRNRSETRQAHNRDIINIFLALSSGPSVCYVFSFSPFDLFSVGMTLEP